MGGAGGTLLAALGSTRALGSARGGGGTAAARGSTGAAAALGSDARARGSAARPVGGIGSAPGNGGGARPVVPPSVVTDVCTMSSLLIKYSIASGSCG